MGDDEWACFGSDSSDEDGSAVIQTDGKNQPANVTVDVFDDAEHDDCHSATASLEEDQRLVGFIVTKFLKANSKVPISKRRVMIFDGGQESEMGARHGQLRQCFSSRGVEVITVPYDRSGHFQTREYFVDCAMICVDSDDITSSEHISFVKECVVPGGFVVYPKSFLAVPNRVEKLFNIAVWMVDESNEDVAAVTSSFFIAHKRRGLINSKACPWKSSSPSNRLNERKFIEEITVARSAYEIQQPRNSDEALNDVSIDLAKSALLQYGIVIIRDLFDIKDISPWKDAALRDLDDAIEALRKRSIDLLNPGSSENEPLSYHELAMREDLRCDLRNGKAFRKIRKDTTAQSIRMNPVVAKIVKEAFNPKGQHFRGNYGRYNFHLGGPDGSPLPLKIGEVGAVISMPGAADQAIHADTPHLFEYADLPPHYANLFITTTEDAHYDRSGNFQEVNGDSLTGGTAFVIGSHKLKDCEFLMSDSGRRERDQRTIRPSLRVGDALIFDCRLLHFGLANASDKFRPLLYINLTHEWFVDPKNWEDREKLFPNVESVATGGGLNA